MLMSKAETSSCIFQTLPLPLPLVLILLPFFFSLSFPLASDTNNFASLSRPSTLFFCALHPVRNFWTFYLRYPVCPAKLVVNCTEASSSSLRLQHPPNHLRNHCEPLSKWTAARRLIFTVRTTPSTVLTLRVKLTWPRTPRRGEERNSRSDQEGLQKGMQICVATHLTEASEAQNKTKLTAPA